jgi:exodeoxyribonuclease VII large subunit
MEFDSPSSSSAQRQDILTVSQLNQAVARLLERSFPLAWVSGEISNFTRASSGHWYFTLKDAQAQVRSVMFRSRTQALDFAPREGDRVEVRATVSLYAARGDFQLNVEAMRRAGVGNLYEAFLKLKEKLAGAGWFESERKRPLPSFVRVIGIVTSPQAAALRDVISALQRRAPHVALIIYPTPVQGEGAAEKIATSIATASRRAECDVLLVCRGGGSLEDLWSFNDEKVARAIVDCAMPVVAGIGHETDFTIADFVADLRAPTPTAAAELSCQPRAAWLTHLHSQAQDLGEALQRQLAEQAQQLDWLSQRLPSPSAVLSQQHLRLEGLSRRLNHATVAPLASARHRLSQAQRSLQHAVPDLSRRRAQLAVLSTSLSHRAHSQLTTAAHGLSQLSSQLELLAPQRTLERGYAIVQNDAGSVLRDPAQLHPQQNIYLRLAGGAAQIEIAQVKPAAD